MEHRSENDVTRREFLGHCGSMLQAIALVGGIGPLIAACEDEPTAPTTGRTVEIGIGSLDADGKFLVSDEKGSDDFKILVVRKDASTYLAMSTKCTHEGCEVGAPANNRIECPCHGSRFAMDGAVINGPATRPLTRYEATLDAGRSILKVKV